MKGGRDLYPIGTRLHWAHNGVSKRIFVLRGADESDFEEAIFILKEDAGLSDGEFLAEAEALAGDFSQPRRTGRGGKLAWLLSLTLFLLLAASWILYFTVL
ncbi:MAG: hypothetical protein IJM21_07660 [Clostridia bacterium]|nr:hypothetical protein [Clostridia bacterium]